MMYNGIFVSPSELEAMIAQGDESLAIVDVTWLLGQDIAEAYYRRAHIPNARFLAFEDVITGSPGQRGRHPLPKVEDLQEALSAIGVRSNDLVVFYDQGDCLPAARAALTLRHFGHGRVAVLLGGFNSWIAQGHRVSAEIPFVEPAKFLFDMPGGMDCFVDVDAIETGRGYLIDVRDRSRFLGISEPIDRVAGHIPGALNIPYAEIFHPLSGIKLHVLESFLRENNIALDVPIVTYCGSGVTASFMALAFEQVGVSNAKVYVGSWSEWIEDPNREISVNTR